MENRQQRAAVIPAKGIGDALLMMIAANQLHSAGYQVSVFHPALLSLSSWFPTGLSIHHSPIDLSSYDLIISQTEKTAQHRSLLNQRQAGLLPQLIVFHPNIQRSSNQKISPQDLLFDAETPMTHNIARAIGKLLKTPDTDLNNGLTPPSTLKFRRYPKRVVIHPVSSDESKNWKAAQFLSLALKLKEKGYEPVFALPSRHYSTWVVCRDLGLEVHEFSDLPSFASYIFESGYLIGNDSVGGHLASNLAIPYLVISNDYRRMRHWRPGWGPGKIITPPKWIPNLKFSRFRENHWKKLISVRSVLRSFLCLAGE